MEDMTTLFNWILNTWLSTWNTFSGMANFIGYFIVSAFFVRKAIKALRKIY